MKKLLLATILLLSASAFAKNSALVAQLNREIQNSDEFIALQKSEIENSGQAGATVDCSNFEIKSKLKMPSVSDYLSLTVYTVTARCAIGNHMDGDDSQRTLISLVSRLEDKDGAPDVQPSDVVRSVVLLRIPGLE